MNAIERAALSSQESFSRRLRTFPVCLAFTILVAWAGSVSATAFTVTNLVTDSPAFNPGIITDPNLVLGHLVLPDGAFLGFL